MTHSNSRMSVVCRVPSGWGFGVIRCVDSCRIEVEGRKEVASTFCTYEHG